MSYTAAVRDFLQRKGSSEGILIIQNDGTWTYFPSGHPFELARYAVATNPTEALLEAADDLDNLESK